MPSTWVGQIPLWAASVVSRPAEWISCLMESAHLVLGRPLGLFQPWMVKVKASSYMEGGWHAVEMSEPAQAALSY